MSKMFRIGALAVIPALTLLAACSDSQTPLSEDEALINSDVAQYVAENTSDDIVVMTAEAQVAMMPGFARSPNCERLARFKIRCQPRKFLSDGNLNITREVTFYKLEGDELVEMEEYHALDTEAINYVLSIEGSREGTKDGAMYSMTVDRQRDFTVSGMTGDEEQRTWNGRGTADLNRTRTSDENGDRTYDMTDTTTVENVVIRVPREGTWPLSGTITRHVIVEVVEGLEDPRRRERTVVITFNGTQFATIDINGDIFTLDLETREVVRD
jgi:hypothetical protein